MDAKQIFESAEQLMHQEEWQRAIDKLSKGLDKDGTFAWGYYARGYCKYKLGEDREASKDLVKAVNKDSSNEEAWRILGNVYSTIAQDADFNENFEEKISFYTLAKDAYTHAIELNKGKGETYLARGFANLGIDFETNSESANADFEIAASLGVQQAIDLLAFKKEQNK